MTQQQPHCEQWMPETQEECWVLKDLRHFNHGMRCPIHTPQALKGEPELPAGPGIPAYRPGFTPSGPVRPYPPASNYREDDA